MNENFCVLPWLHIQTQPNGFAYPCCQYSYSSPIGDVTKNTLDEIANGEEIKLLRKNMMNGVKIEQCLECNKTSKDENNLRNEFNNFYKDIIPDLIKNTDVDGTYENWKLKFVNVRYSNLCNFACRTCGPDNSSLWAQENNLSNPVVNITDKVPNYIDDIIKKLHEIDFINFTGGESLLVDENWQILDEIINQNLTDIKITLITNLSKLQYKNRNLIEYAKKFKNFTIIVSLDSIQERANLYRHGTNWDVMENNLKALKNNNINFIINVTIGAMNVWHFPDAENYLYEKELIGPNTVVLNNLVYQRFLSTKILPIEFKKEVIKKIEKHQNYLEEKNLNSKNWNNIKDYMLEEDHTFLLKNFIKFNKFLDKKRGEKFLQVFPELKKIMS